VGSYPAGASPYGLLDMAGNVWEWVDPDGGGDRPHIVRGGAFLNSALMVRCDSRFTFEASDGGSYFIGVRVVLPRP
jgi:iron(II)-dependent oxidoreductase